MINGAIFTNMTDEKVIPRDNVRYEKVILEKIGPHVEIHGPYTKRELRRLLLSSVSLYPHADNEKEKLREMGISEKELRNIKDGQEISEDTKKTLQDLEISEYMLRKAANEGASDDSGSEAGGKGGGKNKEKSEKNSEMVEEMKNFNEKERNEENNGREEEEKQWRNRDGKKTENDGISEGRGDFHEKVGIEDKRRGKKDRKPEEDNWRNEKRDKKNRRVAEDGKIFHGNGKGERVDRRQRQESIEDAKQNFIEMLEQKRISQDLIKQLLENGLTEEAIRLLNSLGFSSNDLEKLHELWQIQSSGIGENKFLESGDSETSSSDDHMSLECLYLKSNISGPIRDALREIVLKKPKDPVEFLGQWLLHFKVCEEREKKRKECKMELFIEREKLKLKQISEHEVDSLDQIEDEREENSEETWDFSEESAIYNY